MRYMGIDYGTKRVGVALSDESGVMGFPHAVFPNDAKLVGTLLKLIHEKNVGALVVGVSHDLSLKDNPLEERIMEFIQEFTLEIPIPIHRESELFSTQRALREQGRNAKTDASAAAILLNSYFARMKKTP